MKIALVDSNGIVRNVIVYDGVAPFIPPIGQTVQHVNDWVDIGQNQNVSIPPPPIVTTPIPDLATQLAAILISKGTIATSDLNTNTLTAVNATLASDGQATLSKS